MAGAGVNFDARPAVAQSGENVQCRLHRVLVHQEVQGAHGAQAKTDKTEQLRIGLGRRPISHCGLHPGLCVEGTGIAMATGQPPASSRRPAASNCSASCCRSRRNTSGATS